MGRRARADEPRWGSEVADRGRSAAGRRARTRGSGTRGPDRLARSGRPDGSLVVVDFKTGATVPSKAAVAENAQLGTVSTRDRTSAAFGRCRPQDRTLGDAVARSPKRLPAEPSWCTCAPVVRNCVPRPAPGRDDPPSGAPACGKRPSVVELGGASPRRTAGAIAAPSAKLPAAALRPAGDPMRSAARLRRAPRSAGRRRTNSTRSSRAPLAPGLVVAGAGLRQDRDDGAPGWSTWSPTAWSGRIRCSGLTFTRKAAAQLDSACERDSGRCRRCSGRPARPDAPARSHSAGEPDIGTYHAFGGRLIADFGAAGRYRTGRDGADADGVLAVGPAGGRPVGRRPGHRPRPR